MNITITKTTHPGTLPPSDQLGFGTVFTDHMFLMDYSADKGWHDARVVPYGPITMSPAASVLHYGTEVFEGMKAYRRPDGGVQLFRPWENVARLNRSCERLGLPQLDPDDALQAIKTVVKVDENWVPSDPGTSLYIRPFLYGTDPTLALHGVHEATFAIILSPSGSYFKNGLQPVPIMVETEDVRAVRGGTGEAKCGGNYGAANRAGDRAIEKGFSQVLWLDGVERKYVEEGGGMNVMFKINGTVVTPALTGSILRGVTRKSAIELLKSWGVPVEAPPYRHRQARRRKVTPFKNCHAYPCRNHPQPARRYGCRRSVCRSRKPSFKHLLSRSHFRIVRHSHTEHPRRCHHLHANASGRQQPMEILRVRISQWSRRANRSHRRPPARLISYAGTPLHARLCCRCYVLRCSGRADTRSLKRSAQ